MSAYDRLPPICGDCEDHGDGSYTCDPDLPACRYRVRPFDDVNPAPTLAARRGTAETGDDDE